MDELEETVQDFTIEGIPEFTPPEDEIINEEVIYGKDVESLDRE